MNISVTKKFECLIEFDLDHCQYSFSHVEDSIWKKFWSLSQINRDSVSLETCFSPCFLPGILITSYSEKSVIKVANIFYNHLKRYKGIRFDIRPCHNDNEYINKRKYTVK